MQQKAKQQSFWQVCCKCITRTVLGCQCITKRGNWSYPFQVITHGSQGNFLLLEKNKLVNEEPSFCPRKHTLQLFLLRCQRKLFRTGRKKKKQHWYINISSLDCTMHIYNITWSHLNVQEIQFPQASNLFPLHCAEQKHRTVCSLPCLLLECLLQRGKHPEDLPATILFWSHSNSRQYLTHLNVIKITCHRIKKLSE